MKSEIRATLKALNAWHAARVAAGATSPELEAAVFCVRSGLNADCRPAIARRMLAADVARLETAAR